MNWAEKVRRIVSERGYSYRAIEERADWSRNTLKKAMGNRATVGADKAIRLARALNTRAEWLFDDSKGWESRPVVTPDGDSFPEQTFIDREFLILARSIVSTFATTLALVADGRLEATTMSARVLQVLDLMQELDGLDRDRRFWLRASLTAAVETALDPDTYIAGYAGGGGLKDFRGDRDAAPSTVTPIPLPNFARPASGKREIPRTDKP